MKGERTMATSHFIRALGRKTGRGPLAVLALASLAGMALAFGQPLASLAQDAEASFPVTVMDDEGTEVTIEELPERIISLSPANTEIVFALGAGDRLVGGTDYDDYPAEAAAVADVATFTGVIMEQVVELEPDLVLAAGNAFTKPDEIARLRDLGYPVVVVYAADVPAVLADIELIGRAIGEAEAANVLTEEMAARMEAIADAAGAQGSTPRTYYELDFFEGATFGPAPDSFVADMVGLAGGEAVTTGDPALFEMPLERLVAADPEVIVLGDAAYGVCPADVALRAGWADMTAVANDQIRPVDGVPITRPGPRLADGLAALALAIHPDLELADPPAAPAFCAAD
jgi:iron complex transport system substrate-binding protein